jgi:hypothetical protein
MKKAADLRGVKSNVLLEGIALNTSPDNTRRSTKCA